MKLNLTVLFFAFLSIFSLKCFGQDSQIKKISKTQLHKWLAKIPVGSETKYGFISRKEFGKCLLGQEIQMITLEKDEKAAYKIKQLNEWRVPILYQGDFRTLSTVSKINGRYKMVGIGGNLLAKEIQEYKSNFELKNVYLLRLYSLQMDFLVFVSKNSSIEQGTYYPLQSAKQKIARTGEQNPTIPYNFLQLLTILTKIENQ